MELCVVLAWLAALLTKGTGAQSQNSNSSVITSYGENIQVTLQRHLSAATLHIFTHTLTDSCVQVSVSVSQSQSQTSQQVSCTTIPSYCILVPYTP